MKYNYQLLILLGILIGTKSSNAQTNDILGADSNDSHTRFTFLNIEKSGYKNYQHFVPKKNKTKAYQATGEIFFLSKSDTLEAVLK